LFFNSSIKTRKQTLKISRQTHQAYNDHSFCSAEAAKYKIPS